MTLFAFHLPPRALRVTASISMLGFLTACANMPLKPEVDRETGQMSAVEHGKGSDTVTGEDSKFGVTGDTSDTGAGGVAAYWQHSNIGGNGETIRLSAIGGLNEQAGEVYGLIPNFAGQDVDLVGKLRGRHFSSDAYEQIGGEGMLGLTYNTAPGTKVTPYITGEYAEVEDWHGDYDPLLFGAGVLAEVDTTDDPLDPSTGIRLRAKGAYYMGDTPGIVDDEVGFFLGDIHASGYYAFDAQKRYVLAGRARFAMTAGEEREDMPATKRLYSGGVGTVNGGQVRGYSFQSIGDQRPDGTPLGGNSVLETGVEMRMRVHERIGIVPFIDGGAVYADSTPDFDQDFQWAGGLGLRYYSEWGPLRIDVATPINGRDNDDEFQVYVGVGQAF